MKRNDQVLAEYQEFLGKALIKSRITEEVAHEIYRVICLIGKVGEISGKLKRIIRDKNSRISKEDRHALDIAYAEIEKFLQGKTARPRISRRVAYILYRHVGQIEESGEVSEKLEDLVRKKNSRMNKKDRLARAYEYGDELWYFSQKVKEDGFTLKEIVKLNIKKLSRRIKKKTIRGSGDKR